MKIIGANVTGSFILNGQDVTTTIQTSNAWSGSAASSISSLNTASGSAITRLSALEVTSGSNITRLSALETTSGSNITRLNSLEAKTGSYATTGSNTFVGNQIISGSINTSGSITATGTLTAQTLVVQTITSSIDYVTGSTRFGSIAANTHVFTGSMSVTGSVTATSFAGSGANLTSIPNSALNNSTISGISLGSNLATLTIGTGLSGTSYNGSTGVTIANTGILSISGGTGITVSGPNSNLTITNTITNTNQLTNGAGFITSAGTAAAANSVPWSGVNSGYRENYDLGFRPPNNDGTYSGFRFASPGNDGNAGYFLIRGGSDNDVYTQNGLTIVADLGWLTLAQRTTSGKGVRIMTGTSSTTRMEISTAGLLSVYGTSYAATQTSFSPSLHIRGGYYGGPRLQVYGLDADASGWMGLGTDMAAGAYQFSLYYPNVAGSSISFGRFNGGDGTRYSGYTTTALLSYAGTFTAAGDIVAYGSPSDITLKTNIKPLEGALEKIMKLQGVSFTWKENTDASKLTEIKDDLGFIAQEVQEVLPELVRKNKDNGLLSLRDKGIMPLLVEAIKEQQTQIEELKTIINGLTK